MPDNNIENTGTIPSFDEQVTNLRNELMDIAKTRSVRLEEQKIASKQPITRLTIQDAFQQAASVPDYKTFMDQASPLSSEQKNEIWAQTRLGAIQSSEDARKGKVFSSNDVNNSAIAYAANLGLMGLGAASRFTGDLVRAGTEVSQAVRVGGLSQDDVKLADSVKRKRDVYFDAVEALKGEKDPEKAAILRARIEANSSVNYTEAEQSIYKEGETTFLDRGGNEVKQKIASISDRYEMLRKGNAFQAQTEKFFSSISDIVNTDDKDTLLSDASAGFDRQVAKFSDAIQNFEDGRIATGLGDIISGVAGLTAEGGEAIITNPGGVFQLVLESSPDMVAASRAMPVALAANYIQKQQEAKDTYRKEYGSEPVGEALTKLNGYALAGAVVDSYADRLVTKGGIDLTKLATAAGLKTGVKSIDTIAKYGTKGTQATATGAVAEFVAEGGGNLLTQQAGKQDVSKLDYRQAYVEGVAGAGAGGSISTVASALGSAGEISLPVAQKMQARSEAKKQGSIKDLVSDISSMDVAGATAVMKSILSSAESTPEQKAEAVRDLEGAFAQEALTKLIVEKAQLAIDEGTATPAQVNTVKRGNQILQEMDRARETLKVTKDSVRGTSVESAYQTLTTDAEITPEISRQAAYVISDDVNSTYSSISTEMAREILDKRADVLTADQVSNLRSYVTTNEAFDKLTDRLDENKVRSNIVEGGNGNIGARTYVNAIISSMKAGDVSSAKSIAGDLASFTTRHIAKAAAMKQIIASFDAGTPMSAEQQVALMAPFNSKAKGSQFKPFQNAVPKYARMIQDEAQMLQIVSNEMNSRIGIEPSSSVVSQERVDAEVPGTGTEAATNDLANNVSTGEEIVTPEPVQPTEAPSATPPGGVAVGEVSNKQISAVSSIALKEDYSRLDTGEKVVAYVKTAKAVYEKLNSINEDSRTEEQDQLRYKLKQDFNQKGNAVFDWDSLFDGIPHTEEQVKEVQQLVNPTTTLNDLLAMSEDKAIASMSMGTFSSEDDSAQFEPGSEELPDSVTVIKTIKDNAGTDTLLYVSAVGDIYATQNDEVVAYIEQRPETNETVLQGSQALPTKSGVGTAITAEFLKRNPAAKAGTFTQAGEATYRAALRKLKAEQSTVLGTTQADAVPEISLLRDLVTNADGTGNLVKDFFRIKEAKVAGNPLINDPQFINKLRTEGATSALLKKYLPDSYLVTEAQLNLLNKFIGFNEAFRASFTETFRPTELKYAHRAFINYFTDSTGAVKETVVDAMSVSAFNWLLTKSNESLSKTNEDLGTLVGTDSKNYTFSNYTHSTLGKAGLPYNEEVMTLGNEIVSTLGLGVSREAPYVSMGALAASLGGHTMQALAATTAADGPLIKFIDISFDVRNIADLIENQNMDEKSAREMVASTAYSKKYSQKLRTIQANFTESDGFRKPVGSIQGMVLEPAKAAGSFLSKLFSTIEPIAAPRFTPVTSKEASKAMKRTDRKISDFAKGVHDKFNSTKTFLKPNMVKAFQQYSVEDLAEMFGHQTDLKSKVHKDNLESEESKNNLIMTNVQNVFTFLDMYQAETQSTDLSTPFYLDHETTSVNRAQLTQRIMNMQSDKIARHMAYRDGWNVAINTTNQDQMNTFKLAVGQALGVSLDKNSNTKSLEQVNEILNKPEIEAGVLAAVALLNDSATTEQLADLKAAVMSTGTANAALDGIMAYAGFVDAFNKRQSTFETNLAVEHDGVTNGPMITLMQFGLANGTWADDLSAGGIYINSNLENVPDAKAQGINDVYEKVTIRMADKLSRATSIPMSNQEGAPAFKLTAEFKAALNTLFGELTKSDEATQTIRVSKEGRNIAKGVVTPKTYQAGDYATKQKLGNEAIKTLRSTLTTLAQVASNPETDPTKIAEVKSRAKAIYMALEELAPGIIKVPVVGGKKDYLNASIGETTVYPYESTLVGKPIKTTFAKMVSATYGTMFTESVNEQNILIAQPTADAVTVSNVAVMVYETARTILLDQAKQRKFAATEGVTNPLLRELTVNEVQEVERQLERMFPEVYTALSHQTGSGISLVSKGKDRSSIDFTSEIKLTDKAAPSYGLDGTMTKAPAASTVNSPSVTIEAPGVRGVVNNILATDGTIMLKAIDKDTSSLNLYDAHMSGMENANEVSKELNRSMFNVMLNHSVLNEVADMAVRVIKGLQSLVGDDFKFTPEQLKKYQIKSDDLNSVSDALMLADTFKKQANYLTEAKKKALLSSKVVINHYYSEGSAVTFINGTEVDATTLTDSEMTQEYVAATEEAVQTVQNSNEGSDLTLDDAMHSKDTAGVNTPSIVTILDSGTEVIAPEVSIHSDEEVYSPELDGLFISNKNVLTPMQVIDFFKKNQTESPTLTASKAILDKIGATLQKKGLVIATGIAQQTALEGPHAVYNNIIELRGILKSARGIYATYPGSPPIVIINNDREVAGKNGMNQQTVLHELMHAVYNDSVTDPNSPVSTEVNSILSAVKVFIRNPDNLTDPVLNKLVQELPGNGYLPHALSNAKELMAYGLTDSRVQYLLSKVPYQRVTGTKITPDNMLGRFKELLVNILFGKNLNANVQNRLTNALASLLDMSVEAINTDAKESFDISMQQGGTPFKKLMSVTKLNSIGIFNSLAQTGFVKASAAHQVRLESMLNSVVNVVLNPLNVDVITTATSESVNELTAHDKLQIFIADNVGLQLSNLPTQYGFNKSAQELYVHGLYLNILEEGLSAGSPHLNAANDFFNKAAEALTYKDFMEDPTVIDPAVIKSAQDRYDSVFNVSVNSSQQITDTSSGLSFEKQKSDYLRNFLALAATNQQFRSALDRIPVSTKTKPTTLFERVVDLLTTIIDWVSNRIVGVSNTRSTTANIDMLTKRLVGVELEAQSQLEKAFNTGVEYSSTALGGALDVFKKGLYKVGTLPVFAKSKYTGIRLLSGIARITGNNKTQYLFDVAGEMFARMNKGKQTFAGALLDEVKGTTKDNAKVHSMLRVANFTLDRSRKAIIEALSATLDKQFVQKLTKTEATDITKIVLRTDMAALIDHGYSLANMADLLTDGNYLAAEIQSFEDRITAAVPRNIATFYHNQAEDLGFTMVKGFSSNAATIPNAYGIARLWGTQQGQPDAGTIETVEPLIDALATLQAIKWVRKTGTRASNTANVIRREINRTDGDNGPDNNGMVFVLKQHQDLKAKALNDNFGGKGALMRKGYLPDITNPYIDVQPAPVTDRAEMIKRGYKEAYLLTKDATDPSPGAMALFVGDGAGLTGYMRGALSTTGKSTKGTRVRDYGDVALMQANKYAQVQKLFTTRVSPANSASGAYMQALFNEDGMVVDYRYMMAEATKDTLLSRNENYSEVLGALAGSVYDKTATKTHNEKMIDALKEQYDLDIAAGKSDLYLRVSPRSTDGELKDLYNLIPYETKQYAQQVFGTDSIPVRAEFIPVVFGYRKLSIGQLWKDGGIDNNLFQNAVKTMFEALFGASGMQRATQGERILQDIVRVAKSNVVVRMGQVTLANLLSNTYDLMVNGLTMKEAIADQVTGYKKSIEYVRQGQRIAELDLLLKADHNPSERTKMINERTQLKHLQSINPVNELIEAGLLQTIVMDVTNDTDPFSYSSILANKIEDKLSNLPQGAIDAGKFLFMTKDSASFEFMNKITQFSDLAARYALYKKLTTRTNNPMDKSSALQTVIDQFVNYDLPTHKAIQYGNDIGLIWFSRYWLRIQKIIVKNFAENPARVLLGLSVQGILGEDLPDNADSSILATGPLHPVRGLGGIYSGLVANPIVPEL